MQIDMSAINSTKAIKILYKRTMNQDLIFPMAGCVCVYRLAISVVITKEFKKLTKDE